MKIIILALLIISIVLFTSGLHSKLLIAINSSSASSAVRFSYKSNELAWKFTNEKIDNLPDSITFSNSHSNFLAGINTSDKLYIESNNKD